MERPVGDNGWCVSMRLPPEDTLLEAGVEVGLSNRGISCCSLQIKEMRARTTPSSEPRSAQQSSQPQRHLHFHPNAVKMELENVFDRFVTSLLLQDCTARVWNAEFEPQLFDWILPTQPVSRAFRWALLMSHYHSMSQFDHVCFDHLMDFQNLVTGLVVASLCWRATTKQSAGPRFFRGLVELGDITPPGCLRFSLHISRLQICMELSLTKSRALYSEDF